MTRISSGYSKLTSADVTALLVSKSQTSVSPNSSKTNLLLEQPSQNATVNKIEKHISDVKSGNGDSSKDVAYLLGQKDSTASSILSQTNPRALALYSGYLSGLRYDRAARFVNGVEFNLNSLSQIGKKESSDS